MIAKDLDQTIFSEEQQFVDETGTPIAAVSTAKRKKVAVLLGVGLLLVVISLLALFSPRRPPKTQFIPFSPVPTTQGTAQNTYLDQIFDELYDQVDMADPSENIFPFPPIEADIRISTPQNR